MSNTHPVYPHRPTYYLLNDERETYPVFDPIQWAKVYETQHHRNLSVVGKYRIGPHRISTVFLGLDHSFAEFDAHAEPILFESMLFSENAEVDQMWQRRYHTWDEAITGHRLACSTLAEFGVDYLLDI